MSEIVLKVKNVSKIFSVPHENDGKKGSSFLRSLVSAFNKTSRKDFCALRDISFEVEQGMSLGIIGMNGAGKSTLLKILSDIMCPSSGTIDITGKLAAILDIGVGLNQELTGRENIMLYGKMLGFHASEISAKTDEIIAFSELEDFIDSPVKLYSSGMMMRLGFSIISSLDADIILLDEILAVGDVVFRNKCANRIIELKNKKQTFIIVGHDLNDISNYCDTVLLIHKGNLLASGPPSEIISKYNEILLEEKIAKGIKPESNYLKKDLNILFGHSSKIIRKTFDFSSPDSQSDAASFELLSATVESDKASQESETFTSDSEINIKVRAKYIGGKGDVAFIIRDIMNHNVFGDFLFAGRNTTLENPGTFTFQWTIPEHILNEGIFKVGIILFNEEYHSILNHHEALVFKISGSDKTLSSFGFYAPVRPSTKLDITKESLQSIVR